MNPARGDDPGGAALPPPDAAAIAHSDRLRRRIVAAIDAAGGVIRFDRFMQMALYEPALGYYSAGLDKLGEGGDFVTAPEISPLFGDCLARQFEALVAQGCASRILEFGAGSGRLCAQLFATSPALEQYLILEVSADLRARQQALLGSALDAETFARIEWLDRLPSKFDGLVIANEVVDAMPVRLAEKRDSWVELGVSHRDGSLAWQATEPDAVLGVAIEAVERDVGVLPAPYRAEFNLNLAPWLRALADACRRAVVLIVDYGYERPAYYHPARCRGTLVCHYRHRVHDDPLWYPGLQDLSAFVDFDTLADAAEEYGFAPLGLVTQARFLLANGLLEAAARRHATIAETRAQIELAQQVKTLTLPQEMGEKFKVLGLALGVEVELPALVRSGRDG